MPDFCSTVRFVPGNAEIKTSPDSKIQSPVLFSHNRSALPGRGPAAHGTFTPRGIAKRRHCALARQVNETNQQPQHTKKAIGPESSTRGNLQHVLAPHRTHSLGTRAHKEQRPARNHLSVQSARETCLRPGHAHSTGGHESPGFERTKQPQGEPAAQGKHAIRTWPQERV